MDVDGSEHQLISQFNSMVTDDKDELVSTLKSFLDNKLNEKECIFFLDMNNWLVLF